MRHRGDYSRALAGLEKSFKIQQELGNKSSMTATLHNMAIIAGAKNDTQTFLQYETKAYRLAQETQNNEALFHIGLHLGMFHFQYGDPKQQKTARAMLKQSLQIGKAAGFPEVNNFEPLILAILGS